MKGWGERMVKLFNKIKSNFNEFNDKKAICWDLDETLGSFRRICYELNNEEVPSFLKDVFLKPGLEDLLEKLSEEDYLHFVTSSGSLVYVEEVLGRMGIKDWFEKIYGAENLKTRGGKYYLPIVDYLGFSKEKTKSDLMIIGNSKGDKPLDLQGVVFMEYWKCYEEPSEIIYSILKELNGLGDSNFNKGFEKMYNSSQEILKQPNLEHGKTYDLDNIKMEMGYRTDDWMAEKEEDVIPTITNICIE